MGDLSGRRTTAAVDRVMRRMAFEAVRDRLARIPDDELAVIALDRDGVTLADYGIDRPLLTSLVGDAEDERERQRRLKDAFALSPERKQRVWNLIKEVRQHDG